MFLVLIVLALGQCNGAGIASDLWQSRAIPEMKNKCIFENQKTISPCTAFLDPKADSAVEICKGMLNVLKCIYTYMSVCGESLARSYMIDEIAIVLNNQQIIDPVAGRSWNDTAECRELVQFRANGGP
ncbi:hypothetical protein Ddc_14556 [Ditylenchus destructor]|nr:hypothetical protein Ddc_14556 [Ditylenchus destructor]